MLLVPVPGCIAVKRCHSSLVLTAISSKNFTRWLTIPRSGRLHYISGASILPMTFFFSGLVDMPCVPRMWPRNFTRDLENLHFGIECHTCILQTAERFRQMIVMLQFVFAECSYIIIWNTSPGIYLQECLAFLMERVPELLRCHKVIYSIQAVRPWWQMLLVLSMLVLA